MMSAREWVSAIQARHVSKSAGREFMEDSQQGAVAYFKNGRARNTGSIRAVNFIV